MDNGSIEIDWKLMEKLAKTLGYIKYNPYIDNTYLEEAIKVLEKYYEGM